ncbi:hypothetical protein HCUR_00337 [Holospora curviuscula]|uniref:Uncharacterized protein n=1 Tax=Holospora curviuscula TaxID=1082868 RepID=A0A2S5RDB4_9PROT|nr:hypothetical protein HCUR_00337 [Holospora curviuscula]
MRVLAAAAQALEGASASQIHACDEALDNALQHNFVLAVPVASGLLEAAAVVGGTIATLWAGEKVVNVLEQDHWNQEKKDPQKQEPKQDQKEDSKEGGAGKPPPGAGPAAVLAGGETVRRMTQKSSDQQIGGRDKKVRPEVQPEKNKKKDTDQELAKEKVQSKESVQIIEANNPNAMEALQNKFKAVESAQKNAVEVRVLPDQRIRYHAPERASTNPGPTKGAAHVTEYNPKNGQVRSWHESHDQKGNVNRVHPKEVNGQAVDGPHYPLTQKDLEAGFKGGSK